MDWIIPSGVLVDVDAQSSRVANKVRKSEYTLSGSTSGLKQ